MTLPGITLAGDRITDAPTPTSTSSSRSIRKRKWVYSQSRALLDLTDLLGRKVDLAEPDEFKPGIREAVLTDARIVHAA